MFYSQIGIYSQADGSYVYEDIVTEGIHPYYVKTAEGGHYIYLFCEQNDGPFPQMYLRIYDVSGGKANTAAHKDENKDGKCDVCAHEVEVVTEPENPNPDSPQTGDNSMLGVWFIVLMASFAGIIGTTVYTKKRSVR